MAIIYLTGFVCSVVVLDQKGVTVVPDLLAGIRVIVGDQGLQLRVEDALPHDDIYGRLAIASWYREGSLPHGMHWRRRRRRRKFKDQRFYTVTNRITSRITTNHYSSFRYLLWKEKSLQKNADTYFSCYTQLLPAFLDSPLWNEDIKFRNQTEIVLERHRRSSFFLETLQGTESKRRKGAVLLPFSTLLFFLLP